MKHETQDIYKVLWEMNWKSTKQLVKASFIYLDRLNVR